MEPLKYALQLYIYCQCKMNNSEKAGCISAEAIKKGVYFTESSPFQFQEQSSITEFAVVLFMLLITAHSQTWLYLP